MQQIVMYDYDVPVESEKIIEEVDFLMIFLDQLKIRVEKSQTSTQETIVIYHEDGFKIEISETGVFIE